MCIVLPPDDIKKCGFFIRLYWPTSKADVGLIIFCLLRLACAILCVRVALQQVWPQPEQLRPNLENWESLISLFTVKFVDMRRLLVGCRYTFLPITDRQTNQTPYESMVFHNDLKILGDRRCVWEPMQKAGYASSDRIQNSPASSAWWWRCVWW